MEAAAFEQALRPLLRRGAAYAASFLGNRKDAEDAVQQAALQAWHRRAQFDGRRPFGAWWFAVLRNHCLDQLRASRRAPVDLAAPAAEPSVSADESVLDRLALGRALDRLPEAHRDVLRLRYFGDLSYREIAQVLDIPQGTVMSRLHAARGTLADLMNVEDT